MLAAGKAMPMGWCGGKQCPFRPLKGAGNKHNLLNLWHQKPLCIPSEEPETLLRDQIKKLKCGGAVRVPI